MSIVHTHRWRQLDSGRDVTAGVDKTPCWAFFCDKCLEVKTRSKTDVEMIK